LDFSSVHQFFHGLSGKSAITSEDMVLLGKIYSDYNSSCAPYIKNEVMNNINENYIDCMAKFNKNVYVMKKDYFLD
jgi:hypothetical protein